MFDAILIRPTSILRHDLDLGELAEAMLFYQSVHLFLSEGELTNMARALDLDTLSALVESGFLNLTILRDLTATHTRNWGQSASYDFGTTERLRQDRSKRSRLEIVKDALERASGKRGKSRRTAYRLLRHVSVGSVNANVPHPKGIPELARADLDDSTYVRSSLEVILETLIGKENLPNSWRFDVTRTETGFSVATNLDFPNLNRLHSLRAAGDYEITPALLAGFIQEARLDLFHSSRLSAELLTSKISSELIKLRLANAVASGTRANKIELFQDHFLEGHRLREAINSGERSMLELLALLDDAERFREWLAQQPDDALLLREYHEAVARETWLGKLPGKTLKFILFTSAGLALDTLVPTGLGTTAGIALGLGDTFLLDKIARGWRPNQFVDRELLRFVNPSGKDE